MKILILGMTLLALLSCTEKKKIPKAVTELDEKISKMEKTLRETDNKLKMALDHGLQIELTHERELLNSRLEREKERMRAMWPTWEKEKEERAAQGGEKEGGGGHH